MRIHPDILSSNLKNERIIAPDAIPSVETWDAAALTEYSTAIDAMGPLIGHELIAKSASLDDNLNKVAPSSHA